MLTAAIKAQDTEFIKLLFDRKMLNKPEYLLPRSYAAICINDTSEITEMILEKIKKEDLKPALERAIEKIFFEAAKALDIKWMILSGSKLSEDFITTQFNLGLKHAAETNDTRKIISIISAGANINSQFGEDNNTALHIAIQKGALDVVRELLNLKADVTLENKQGETCLDLVLENDNEEMHELFIALGLISATRSSNRL